jgi:three-Cys-motif partner protein
MRRGDGNDGPHKPDWGAARLRPAADGVSLRFHTQILSGAERSGPSALGHLSPSLRLGVFQELLKMFLLSAESVLTDFQIPLRGGFLFLGIFLLFLEAWAKVIQGHLQGEKQQPKIAYIDLFAGPGRYKDGASSTPIFILEKAIKDQKLRENLVTVFNDKEPENTSSLVKEIAALPGAKTLRYKPSVYTEEVGDKIVKQFESSRLIPTLMFVDPWGYKGLSLRLINSVLKDWACECIFFFSYNRISMGLPNSGVDDHMDALFGIDRAAALREKIKARKSAHRELMIVEEMCEALVELGGRYVLPFRFRKIDGSRTSHHLIFVSKHPLGYRIMKKVMANESSSSIQGVPSFEYNPATPDQPLLHGLLRPLDDLEGLLEEAFAGRTLSMEAIFNEHNLLDLKSHHNYMLPYTDKNYKDVLNKMELAGKITASKPYDKRRMYRGEKTFADDILVTFPKKAGP